MEKELADIIYIITKPGKPAIQFYDRTPTGVETKMTGSVPEGKFITDIKSISIVTCNQEMAQAAPVIQTKTRNGIVTVKTIQVSEKQFNKIISNILIPRQDKRVVIDTIEQRLEKNNDKEELLELKEKLLSKFEENNIKNVKISIDETKFNKRH